MAWAFVRQGGTNATKTAGVATLAATVPAAGHALGNQVVVTVYGIDGNVNRGTCADSKGNTYAINTPTSAGQNPCVIFVATLTTALVSGDTITWTLPSNTTTGACICTAEFSGGTTTADVTGINKANNSTTTTPTVGPITPGTATALVIGVVGANGPTPTDTFTEDTDSDGGDTWHSLTRTGTSGGGATSNVTLNSAYKITTSAVAQTYNPVLGTSRVYSAAIGALTAASVVADAPPPELVMAAPIARR
jgi:hypothetical protein